MIQGYDYTVLVNNAMRGVVRDVLRRVQVNGLVDPHHFFVTFRTDHPGVTVSEAMRSKYPYEMTIVLQHQFREIKVEQERFQVVLSFNNIPEKLVIPFSALTGFADPSVKFGLQFHAEEGEQPTVSAAGTVSAPAVKTEATDEGKPMENSGGSKVITLDAFRKK